MNAIVSHKVLRSSPKSMQVFLEPGHEEIWAAIGRIKEPSVVTAAELARMAGCSKGAANIYLARLVYRGIAIKAGKTGSGEPVYQVPTWSNWPHVFDSRGVPSKDHARRAALWRSIRMLKSFTLEELVLVADGEPRIFRSQARHFVERLEAAGYLANPFRGACGAKVWKLRPQMNTGSLPPRLCDAFLVYDVNRRRFMNEVAYAQEVKL